MEERATQLAAEVHAYVETLDGGPPGVTIAACCDELGHSLLGVARREGHADVVRLLTSEWKRQPAGVAQDVWRVDIDERFSIRSLKRGATGSARSSGIDAVLIKIHAWIARRGVEAIRRQHIHENYADTVDLELNVALRHSVTYRMGSALSLQ